MKQVFKDIFARHGMEDFEIRQDQQEHLIVLRSNPSPSEALLEEIRRNVDGYWEVRGELL